MPPPEPVPPRNPPNQRSEAALQRTDRNYHELLQEVRVAQIGVQVIFAFLLTAAFSARFGSLTTYQRGIFVADLLLSIMACSLLSAPAAYHRMVFTLKIKDHVVHVATRFAIAGMILLVLAMATGLLLVLDITLGHGFATALAGFVIVWFCFWWYAVPMIKRMKHKGELPARHKR